MPKKESLLTKQQSGETPDSLRQPGRHPFPGVFDHLCHLLFFRQLSHLPAMSKRIRIFTEEDVAKHTTSSSCWIIRNGKVYDVTSFLDDHPGGDDYLLKYAGRDVGAVMKDPEEHEHSDSAYDMMEEFVIGRMGTSETIVDESMFIVYS